MFFTADGINRITFLRSDPIFQEKLLQFQYSKTIVFLKGRALAVKDNPKSLYLPYLTDVSNILAKYREVFTTSPENITPFDNQFSLVFLGLSTEYSQDDHVFRYNDYMGVPVFGIDIRQDDYVIPQSTTVLESMAQAFTLSKFHASIYSYAQMYLKWQLKYKFCPGCGSRMYLLDLGTKVHCSSSSKENMCPVKNANVDNIWFPRTDPIIITSITNMDGSKFLIGRNKRARKTEQEGGFRLFSTVAGFMEPGESVEQACVREAWEETGVRASSENVVLVSSQPWPYPANLMIGCITKVEFNGVNENVYLGHDPELEEAIWFDTQLLIDALVRCGENTSNLISLTDDIKFPGDRTIAFTLLKEIASRYVKPKL
ncbi:hypothetical protein TBLA_0B05320 [Henningerozyma blattae CBS 6284]|uniref:NAD(+) diphosphatase n=1 Tax=Henningerozyma blattae (strain ATCC 34711 / CBS 6284 / DSM 70876 / NBRC 10599 / NRRL Y-10934 / UCD 77-7) TaxID=1071380 RepID=I2GZ12_HENB6|nr:hypothetical protein TBLA_0B05320 [Tetrapisispora blattae CBS 6284]CCH59364.1 hypothetical protein TBLA_0B05320 [Tetrapisispora blattae CBS 6284]